MKLLLTLALLLPLAVMAQTKKDSTISSDALKAWSANDHISMNTFLTGGNTIQRRSDTVACYFLKVPAIIESPEALPVQWFLGWYVNDNYTFKLTYLYLDKQPVKEQVLISIPKDK